MKAKSALPIFFLLLALSSAFSYALSWEYRNRVGIFESYEREKVVVFDATHGDLDRRVLVSSGNCIFTVGQNYAWVEEGTPYLVRWVIYREYNSPNTQTRIISVSPLTGDTK